MKRISFLLIATLLLTSCGTKSEPVATAIKSGKLASCAQIKLEPSKNKGTSLLCIDGKTNVTLEAITGPVLVNVWGSWCPPCRQEIPLLKKAYDEGRVAIVGIDIDEPSIEVGQKYAKRAGITWPNLTDPKGVTKGSFGMGVPVTWFINANGVVTYKHIGAFRNEQQLNQEIDKYL
jgi:thiol-disulfide isomerase/thioredoxin